MEPYETLEMEIIEFDGEDVIATSTFNDESDATFPDIPIPIGKEREGGRYTC